MLRTNRCLRVVVAVSAAAVVSAHVLAQGPGDPPAPSRPGAPKAPASPTAPTPPNPLAPVVTLASPGEGELKALRYAFTAGQSWDIEFSTEFTPMKEVLGVQETQPFPAARVSARVEVKEVAEGGGASLSMTFTGVKAELRPGVPDLAPKTLEDAIGRVVGGWMTWEVDGRGVPSELVRNGAGFADTLVVQYLPLLEQVIPVLPEEPVGKGAIWRNDYEMDNGLFTIHRIVTYSLESIEGGVAEVGIALIFDAPAQPLRVPGERLGNTSVRGVDGEGTGRGTFALSEGVFRELTLESEMTSLMKSGDMEVRTTDTRKNSLGRVEGKAPESGSADGSAPAPPERGAR